MWRRTLVARDYIKPEPTRREQLAVVRPVDGLLSMAMLSYEAEIRKSSEVKTEFRDHESLKTK